MQSRSGDVARVSEEEIRRFLAVGYGYGYGYGSGDGDGSGSSSGYGYGDGYGDGSGSSYGDGYGYGSGSGSGYGDGSGSGYGDGSGSGSGSGSGYGSGDGSGYGSGVAEFCGDKVYMVDGVMTLIYTVHGGYARGAILNGNLTLSPCYIARVGNSFAHGDTLEEARRDAVGKDMEKRPVSERIASFATAYPDADAKIPGAELYDWHHILTGSCRAGRNAWCRDHNLSPERDSLTVREFCRLTCGSYGGEVIRMVAEAYGIRITEGG